MAYECSPPRRGMKGFSLVELMVAVLFVAILMAGMAKVFQSSLGTFYASGETLSSHRRNLMAGEMIYDDLNTAGMYLVDIMAPPAISASNPAFQVTPNHTLALGITDADIPVAQNTVTYDELTLYQDQPLPFEGINQTAVSSNAQMLALGSAVNPPSFTIKLKDVAQTDQVKSGMIVMFKDSLHAYEIDTVTPTTPGSILIKTKDNSQGLSGAPTNTSPTSEFSHIATANVIFVQQAQQVRYTVQLKPFDPSNPAKKIACLVRQQGTYNSAGFTPDNSLESVIAENVTGFKVYLSMIPSDIVQTPDKVWAGFGYTGTDWKAGFEDVLTTQLVVVGRKGFTSVDDTVNPNWFRDLPVAVRIDLTTRTASARTEFNTKKANARAFRDTTQTLVLVPRHFGLTLN